MRPLRMHASQCCLHTPRIHTAPCSSAGAQFAQPLHAMGCMHRTHARACMCMHGPSPLHPTTQYARHNACRATRFACPSPTSWKRALTRRMPAAVTCISPPSAPACGFCLPLGSPHWTRRTCASACSKSRTRRGECGWHPCPPTQLHAPIAQRIRGSDPCTRMPTRSAPLLGLQPQPQPCASCTRPADHTARLQDEAWDRGAGGSGDARSR